MTGDEHERFQVYSFQFSVKSSRRKIAGRITGFRALRGKNSSARVSLFSGSEKTNFFLALKDLFS
jgi:hypothetical protein